jgi:hypothetical protein
MSKFLKKNSIFSSALEFFLFLFLNILLLGVLYFLIFFLKFLPQIFINLNYKIFFRYFLNLVGIIFLDNSKPNKVLMFLNVKRAQTKNSIDYLLEIRLIFSCDRNGFNLNMKFINSSK